MLFKLKRVILSFCTSLVSITGFSQEYLLTENQSSITVEGTSSLQDWVVEVQEYNGNLILDKDVNQILGLKIKIVSKSLKGTKKAMNQKIYDALKTDSFEEIIFINDHSEDTGFEFLQQHMNDLPITLVSLPDEQFGKKEALRYGMEQAHGDYYLTLDADVLFGPNYFSELEKLPTAHLWILPAILIGRSKKQLWQELNIRKCVTKHCLNFRNYLTKTVLSYSTLQKL